MLHKASVSSNMAVHLDVFPQLALKMARKVEACPYFSLPLNKQNTPSETLHIQNHFRVPCKRLLADQFPSLAPYWANSAACTGGVSTLLRDNFSKFLLSAKIQLWHSFWTEIETPEQNIAHSALGLWGAPPAGICITVRSLKREQCSSESQPGLLRLGSSFERVNTLFGMLLVWDQIMEYLKLQNLPAFYESSCALKRNTVATQTHPGQYRPGLFLWNAGLKFNAIYF